MAAMTATIVTNLRSMEDVSFLFLIQTLG